MLLLCEELEGDRLKHLALQPSVICAIFLCSGTSILLYLRTKMGQGSFIIGTMILSCTALGTSSKNCTGSN